MPPESESADPNERFRSRRAQAVKRRRHHRTAGLVVLLTAAGLVVLGATVIGARGHGAGKSSGKTAQ